MQVSIVPLHLGISASRDLISPRCTFRTWRCTIPKVNRRGVLTCLESLSTSLAWRQRVPGASSNAGSGNRVDAWSGTARCVTSQASKGLARMDQPPPRKGRTKYQLRRPDHGRLPKSTTGVREC
jgi:hypothetical protein